MNAVDRIKRSKTSGEANQALSATSKKLYQAFECGKIGKQELNQKIADVRAAYQDVLSVEVAKYFKF